MGSDADRTAHDDLWRTLQIVSEWIRTADTKAGATLAIDGAILAVVTSRFRDSPGPGVLAVIALTAAIALGSASVLLAIWTVVPRARWLKTESISHYGTIAAFRSAADYRNAAATILADTDRLAENLSRHIWAFSRAAVRKYRFVTAAIQLLAGAMLLGALGLLLR
ncbi:Pycsar system effector family protein [Amycolatopsis sp. CA-128772]|uniref:Pycsar system effector family protein n=1 Tax=Amycolatopsis sp. CA-128772 TaxID=2073159 RepID=UPI000CCFE1FF|nr:Pycsar system effector family protein [Amycolatopsis sp. CA-128772]